MSNRMIALITVAVVATLTICVSVWRNREMNQPADMMDMNGFWMIDVSDAFNKHNKPVFLPGPFRLEGKSITLHIFSMRPWHQGLDGGYYRLTARIVGSDLEYRSPHMDARGNHAWEKVATWENGMFAVESQGQKWWYSRRNRQEATDYADYFVARLLFDYERFDESLRHAPKESAPNESLPVVPLPE
jgi:hypothetical protein